MDFEKIMQKYYPLGVSYFFGKYEATQESKLLSAVISKEDEQWTKFLDSCISEFGLEAIDDRTNGEPGHVLLLSVRGNGHRYVVVWYVARILPAYCFRVQSLNNNTIYPDFENKTPKNWNLSPDETKSTIQKLTALMSKHYPNYDLFDGDLETIIPSISTHVHDLAEASVLNIFFTNYSY